MMIKPKTFGILFLLFVLLTLFFDVLPRVFPIPSAPSALGGGEVIFLQTHLSSEVMDYWWVLVYTAGYIFLIYGTATFLLWKGDVVGFKRYFWVFFLSQCFALSTWLLHPVAPPRLAVEGVRDIRGEIFGASEKFNAFVYGAFPSMHAANGLTALLFVRRIGRRWLEVWTVLWLTVLFSTLYLGEHYWQDLAGGGLYSLLSYSLVTKIFARRYRVM